MNSTEHKLRLRDDDGQALVEFALVLPILLLVVLGIFEFGRAYNYWVDETHLANQAARFASVNHRPDAGQTITQYVRNQATTNELKNGTGQVSPGLKLCITTTGTVGDPVRVDATSTYHWLSFLGVSQLQTQIKGSATMRVESPPTAYSSGECAG